MTWEKIKRKQQSFGPYKNRAEAKKELIRILDQVNAGTYFEPSEREFDSFITEWFETVYKPQVQESTYESRGYFLEKRIIPYFGKRPLKSLTKQLMTKFISDQTNEGCSPAYI